MTEKTVGLSPCVCVGHNTEHYIIIVFYHRLDDVIGRSKTYRLTRRTSRTIVLVVGRRGAVNRQFHYAGAFGTRDNRPRDKCDIIRLYYLRGRSRNTKCRSDHNTGSK